MPQPEFWDRFPFTVPLDRLVAAGESRFENAFDPAFKARLRRKISEACAKTKNNPHRLLMDRHSALAYGIAL